MRRAQVRTNRFSGAYSQLNPTISYSLARLFAPAEIASANRNLNNLGESSSRLTKFMRTLQIGNTPIISLPEISDHFGIKQLTIKDESANCFGTHKDRKSLHAVLEAINSDPPSRPDGLCILTAGNAGLSLAGIAALYGLGITAFVGGSSISPALLAQLERACARVIPLDLEARFWSSNELCLLAGAENGRRISDVTNGVIEPFESIVDEICDLAPGKVPDVIVMPVGGGELFLGIARGLNKRGLKTRLIGVTVRKDSAADKLYSKWNPSEAQIKSITSISSNHSLLCLDDEQLLINTFNWLRSSTILKCEPSSAAAFAILPKIKDSLKPSEKVMVVNTGTFKFERESISCC